MRSSAFDLVVVGGGITGAGIALDATARGLKVALVEMRDFASGTSGRSTKLIHGGLRYLKEFDFKLVAEVGKERSTLQRLAPHLVKPEPMLLPLTKRGSLGKFSTRIAMTLYEWLAGVKKEEAFQSFTKDEVEKLEPYFNKKNLLGGILFYEYRTDDARLTLEVLKEAVDRGALVINYVKVTDFIYENEKIAGVKVWDQFQENNFQIRSEYVVNASGPWVDRIDELDKQKEKHLILTKGVHVVVDRTKLPVKGAMYFDTFDKRMIFVIPREGKTYIGTTDTFYYKDPCEPEVTKEDINYLLKCVNDKFSGCKIVPGDIESVWAGVRPLVKKKGKKPSEISRKDELFFSESGLITIAGGKLTGYRKMAERVVNCVADRVQHDHQRKLPKCSTDSIPLSGGHTGISFNAYLRDAIKKGVSLGLSFEESKYLSETYGSNMPELHELFVRIREEKSEIPIGLRTQIIYSIEFEMCNSPLDFFVRRTSLLYFHRKKVDEIKRNVIEYMRSLFSWGPKQTEKYVTELEAELNRLKIFS